MLEKFFIEVFFFLILVKLETVIGDQYQYYQSISNTFPVLLRLWKIGVFYKGFSLSHCKKCSDVKKESDFSFYAKCLLPKYLF